MSLDISYHMRSFGLSYNASTNTATEFSFAPSLLNFWKYKPLSIVMFNVLKTESFEMASIRSRYIGNLLIDGHNDIRDRHLQQESSRHHF